MNKYPKRWLFCLAVVWWLSSPQLCSRAVLYFGLVAQDVFPHITSFTRATQTGPEELTACGMAIYRTFKAPHPFEVTIDLIPPAGDEDWEIVDIPNRMVRAECSESATGPTFPVWEIPREQRESDLEQVRLPNNDPVLAWKDYQSSRLYVLYPSHSGQGSVRVKSFRLGPGFDDPRLEILLLLPIAVVADAFLGPTEWIAYAWLIQERVPAEFDWGLEWLLTRIKDIATGNKSIAQSIGSDTNEYRLVSLT